jgi:plastocyanin
MNISDRHLDRARGLLIGLVLVAAGCSGAPGAPSAKLSAVASPRASAAPSSAPPASSSPSPRPTATPLPEGTFMVLSTDFRFRPLALDVEVGKPFTIVFKNSDDPGVIHDIDILEKDKETIVVDQPTTDGGQTATYEYPKLEAREYVFICTVHPIPEMTGRLLVS